MTPSISKDLIDSSNLSVAGDGTPVVTFACERKHRICDCLKKALRIAPATVTFHNLTVISDGILPGIVFIMAMISTC